MEITDFSIKMFDDPHPNAFFAGRNGWLGKVLCLARGKAGANILITSIAPRVERFAHLSRLESTPRGFADHTSSDGARRTVVEELVARPTRYWPAPLPTSSGT